VAGPTPAPKGTGTLPPKLQLDPEPKEFLQEWNAPYHATRAALREEQTQLGAGPLREHTFFTTDCTFHSLWQASALEHSWAHVNNIDGGGFMSRIVSGCKKARQPDLKRHVIPSREDNQLRRKEALAEGRVGCDVTADDGCFGVFFAPTFSHLPSGEFYAPYNRPNGIWFWLNHSDLTEDVFILLDPDMIYLSRLHGSHVVRPGRPAAQYYGYMDFDRLGRYECELCATPGSFDRKEYAVGPPWMIAISDLRTIMATWVALVPVLKKIDNNWIVEMVAYAVACAFHKLPHTLLQRGMVDNVAQQHVWDGYYLVGHAPAGREKRLFETGLDGSSDSEGGRPLPPPGRSILDAELSVEPPATEQASGRADTEAHRRWWHTASEWSDRARREANASDKWWKQRAPTPRDADEAKAPVALLHYCYTWEVGEAPPQGGNAAAQQHGRISARDADRPVTDYFHWSKYRTPTDWPGGKARFAHNFVSCDCPLLQEFHTPWALPKAKGRKLNSEWIRTSHFLHLGIPAVNEAMRAFKRRYCSARQANVEERLRTSHPSYWVSKHNIDDFRKPAEGGETGAFV
jgi:hypothetical protein